MDLVIFIIELLSSLIIINKILFVFCISVDFIYEYHYS